MNDRCSDSGASGPITHRVGHTVMTQSLCVTSVGRLLMTCGPSTITWFIATVVVDAVNGVMNRWPWAHVCQKSRVIGGPFDAHLDPSATVPRVGAVARIVTTSLRGHPCAVFSRHLSFVVFCSGCLSMHKILGGSHFSRETSATLDVTRDKMAAGYKRRCAAVTSADPPSQATAKVGASSNYGESSEAQTSFVNKTHGLIIQPSVDFLRENSY